MTPFPSSISNSPLMIFNHFLLQEFVNPWILHDYFILIVSGFNICSLFWMVPNTRFSWNLFLLHVFWFERVFASWLNLNINYVRPLIWRKLPWVMLKLLAGHLTSSFIYSVNIHLFLHSFILSFIYLTTDGFYVYSFLCVIYQSYQRSPGHII